jgi:preprotein translocase subunit Sss1
MSKLLLAYIAGFLDGDGCLMAQLVRHKDYLYGYQIRLSLVFYQKLQNIGHLVWLKKYFQNGYIRDRKDGMAEYAIVGVKPVAEILKKIKPYLRLKKKQAELLLKISKMTRKPKPKEFIKFCKLVDESAKHNYSKKRKITSADVKKYLTEHKIIPRND